jgi:hypothetical protein
VGHGLQWGSAFRAEHDIRSNPGQARVQVREFVSVHGIQEDAVDSEPVHQGLEHILVRSLFPASAAVPGVVVDEHAYSAPVAVGDELTQPPQAAGHVPVEIHLIAFVHPDPRIRVPQDQDVVATELFEAVIEEPVEGVAPGPRVVDPAVVEESEVAGEGVRDP